MRYAIEMRLLPPPAFTLRAAALLLAAALPACGGGAIFIGNGVAATLNVPPPNGNGNEVLSVVTSEPAGVNCLRGGSRVDAGIDYNRNGVLDSNEISSTRFVCNDQISGVASNKSVRTGVAATAGAPEVLVAVTDEAAGANCAAGGQRIDAGTDFNADGVLDAGEVVSTVYRCGR
jgi:hypothetical protein